MPEITRNEVEKALSDVLAAREAAARKLTDPEDPSKPYRFPPLPAPATPEEIAAAERALGVTLPPSYKHFLSLHNGLPDIDLGSDLLGTRKLVDFNLGRAQKVLPRVLKKIERKTKDGLIVFGTTDGEISMFIFDSNKADEFGEWAAIDFDAEEGMLDEYDNFVDFLEDMAATLTMMART